MDEKARAVVEIFGEEYIMKGGSTPEYMTMLANYIDKKMKQIASRQPQLNVTKIAVLAALNVADELSKLQEDYDTMTKKMDSHNRVEKHPEKSFEKHGEKQVPRQVEKLFEKQAERTADKPGEKPEGKKEA